MNNIFKKIGKSILAMSIVANTFMPLTLVKAEGEFTVRFEVEDNTKFAVRNNETLGHTHELIVDVLGTSIHEYLEPTIAEGTTLDCSSQTVCTYTVPADKTITFEFNSNKYDATIGDAKVSGTRMMSSDTVVSIKEAINNQQEPQQPQEPLSTVDYDVKVELTDNMKQYYELTAGTNVINVTLKNFDSAVTSTIELKKHENEAALTPKVTCNTAKDSCTMVAPANTETKLVFETKHIDLATELKDDHGTRLEGYRPEEEPIRNTKTFKVDEPRDFDGKAALLWECDGKICYNYSEFQDVHVDEYGTFIAANTIENENSNASSSIKFDVHSRVKFFAPYWKFLSRKADIDAADANIDSFKGEGKIDVAPLNEPIENNAYVSYGNRAFKIIIYGEDYKGITIGKLSDLAYYPADWVSWFKRRESFDISGTTKDTPVEMLGYVLQDRINIKKLAYTDYTIESIEPLDVPTGAVVVNSKDDGSYDLVFNSNFYSKVEFKVTDSDGNEHFFVFNRRTTDPYIATEDGGPRAGIVAEVFYDNDLSYTDYTVLAKIQYKDGTTKVVELTGIPYGDDGFGNPVDVIEWDEEHPPIDGDEIPKGRGIKKTKYAYETTKAELKKVDKIYINVERSGSTKNYYEGNFAGSGKGDVLDMKYWEDRL